MSGKPYWNRDAFVAAAAALRAEGWEIHSPYEHDLANGLTPTEDGNTSGVFLPDQLAWDFEKIAESSCVIVLPGWETSTGCHWEFTVAYALGKPVFQYPELTPAELPSVVVEPVQAQCELRDHLWRRFTTQSKKDYAHMRGVDGPGAYAYKPGDDHPLRSAATDAFVPLPGGVRIGQREAHAIQAALDKTGEIRVIDPNAMRTFESGATRNVDETKLDYEGFLSPAALRLYAEYLQKNRVQADGNVRDSDNWQKGIPLNVYMKSAWRHFIAAWTAHRSGSDPSEDLCGLLFNAMGYLHETHKP